MTGPSYYGLGQDEERDEGCTGRLYQKEDQEKSHDSSDHHGGIREEVYEA